MITYVFPTRNRPSDVRRTLDELAALPRHDACVVVVDNASDEPVHVPARLANGIACECTRLGTNRSTAARNVGVERAAQVAGRADDHWIVMLDDDSAPMHAGLLDALAAAPADVGAIAAEVFLPPVDGRARHEAGGLPEVFTGCGAAIRASAFLDLGGYDEGFDYYAEEYDFCARLILAGMRVAYDGRFQVMHRKVATHRDTGRIIGNLARNNAWVMARYAPADDRAARIEAQLDRYARIAAKEGVANAVGPVIADARAAIHQQPRREMSQGQWQRFIGAAACERHVSMLAARHGWRRIEIVAPGKGAEDIAGVIERLGLHAGSGVPDASIVGSLSPGVMLDAIAEGAARGIGLIASWNVEGGMNETGSHGRGT
jgi:GT2 family glycosyltransferase